MSVRRYDVVSGSEGLALDGKWVRYEDYASELAMVRADLELMRVERDEAKQVADHHAAWELVAERRREGLAKALRRLVRELTKADPMHTSGTFASETLEEARAALAALPKEDS